MKEKYILLALAVVAIFTPLSANASSVRPGYKWYNRNLNWVNEGAIMPDFNIGSQAKQKLEYRSETIVGSVVPVYPNSPNIVFISTVSRPDNNLVAYRIYTYHKKLGTLRLFLEETARADSGAAAYSYEPIGMDGNKLVLRRVDAESKPVTPCNPSIDWYLYAYRYNLVYVNVLSKSPKFATYTLPRDIFNRGQKNELRCENSDVESAGENLPYNSNVGNNLEVGVQINDQGYPSIAGCQMYPSDSLWNKNISVKSVSAESNSFVEKLGGEKKLGISFGSDVSSGIPYNVIGQNTKWYDVRLTTGKQYSNPGPYPIPNEPAIESGEKRRMIVLDNRTCYYYEFLNIRRSGNADVWSADLVSVFYAKSQWIRAQKWPSATASGISLLPGLVKYDEVAYGEIRHPLIFTAPQVQKSFITPASAGGNMKDGHYPAFGARFRLKSEYDTSTLPYQAKIIAESLKQYGMILADYGEPWTILGVSDPRWNDEALAALRKIPGSAFEVVDADSFVRIWFD